MTFVDALHGWHDFFLLTGGGAATMLGLVFVAVSFANNLPSQPNEHDSELFVEPILWQFGYAFSLSASCLAPWVGERHYGLFIFVLGVSAVTQNASLLRGILRRHRSSDPVGLRYWVWTGVLPFLTSLLLTLSGALIWRTPHRFIAGIGIATLSLDLMGVRNTWHLVVWMMAARAPHGSNSKRNDPRKRTAD
ncbi:MAG TPA: hypothetical protein VIA18_10910 [Polyangia bacterium]|jgi:hypothetical protein|nr:hypothetical protein [Polyangia bacterium]